MNPSRHIELDIDIGADARDWSAIQAQEKLKPTETELRRVEELVSEIVSEMDYLRTREQKLRDTNESTNERVKWFAFGTMGMLVGLGAWQVVYLRAYFRFVILVPRSCEMGELTIGLQVKAFDLAKHCRLSNTLRNLDCYPHKSYLSIQFALIGLLLHIKAPEHKVLHDLIHIIFNTSLTSFIS